MAWHHEQDISVLLVLTAAMRKTCVYSGGARFSTPTAVHAFHLLNAGATVDRTM